MNFRKTHTLAIILQLVAPAIGIQRYANENKQLTEGGRIDEQPGKKFDDEVARSGEESSELLDDRKLLKLDDKTDGSRVTANDDSAKSRGATRDESVVLSKGGKFEAGSRVTYYDNAEWTALGQMNRIGVTRYQNSNIKRKKKEGGGFYWPDSVNRDMSVSYSGAKDLTESVLWGWHSPSNLYGTIPVGPPLIDGDSNIYAPADDAIRKFDAGGNLLWSYAPRGQLAAALTLSTGCPPSRLAASVVDDLTPEEEELLRPDWAKGNGSDLEHSVQFFKGFKVGDHVKVKAGSSYRADGRDLYSAGDQGEISSIAPDEDERDSRVVIQWTSTGRKSAVQFDAMKNHFVRVEPKTASPCTPMVIGSTTNGYVFSIDQATGYEQWAIQGQYTIAGVKGSLSSKDGIAVLATNRCTDRYCYRYRNQTNPLTPGNTVVRGINVATGAEVWAYVPEAPTWNMNPVWGPDGSVFFNDQEGKLYSLDLATGTERWKVGGVLGTYTEAAAVYDPGHNIVVALGMRSYSGSACNPYVAPGILPLCGNAAFKQGIISGYNATSGRLRWTKTTPHPPASAGIGMLQSAFATPQQPTPAPPTPTRPTMLHTRLVVTMGFNCAHNSPSALWIMDPQSGSTRSEHEGPTLWSSMCAGDKEGGDIRRAMGGRATCSPGSWSAPVVDADGDIYTGNQVGVFQRYGSEDRSFKNVDVLSTLVTGVAFQDASTALAGEIMAVSTCTSLIVFQAYNFADDFQTNLTWTAAPHGYSGNFDASSAVYTR